MRQEAYDILSVNGVVKCKIIHHPHICIDTFELRLKSEDLATTLHFVSDLILVKLEHGRKSQIFSGTVQGVSHFSNNVIFILLNISCLR